MVNKSNVQNNPEKAVKDLKKVEVDLIARSIACQESFTKMKGMVDHIAINYKDLKIPILQAVAVFIKPSGSLVTGAAPLPTYFRPEPSSVNRSQVSTAYFFNVSLRCRLDLKVYEYMDSCGISMSGAIRKYLHPRFLDQQLVKFYRKQVPRHAIDRLGHLDVCGDIKYNYGVLDVSNIEASSTSLPSSLKDHGVTIKFIWLERPNPKYGIASLQIDNKSVLAFFSCNSINTKRYFSDMSSIVWKNMKYVMGNATLMDATSKVPYVLTEMWVVGDKQASSPADTKLVENEWSKIVSLILDDKQSLNFRTLKNMEQLFIDKRTEELLSYEPPTAEVISSPVVEPPSQHLTKGWVSGIKDVVGKVAKVINANYACAVSHQNIPGQKDRTFFVLFDRFDIFKDNEPVVENSELKDKTLKQLMKEGDSIRLHAVHMDVENPWNLVYLATAVVTDPGDTPPPLPQKAKHLPNSSALKPEKVQNFKVVVSAVVKKQLLKDNKVAAALLNERPILPPTVFNATFNTRPGFPGRKSMQWHAHEERAKANRKAVDNLTLEQEAVRISTAKRQELMHKKPELYEELKSMELCRGGQYFYDCKICGIQGMSVEDSEDHLTSESHKEAKARSSLVEQKSKFQNREEADEAIFLNNNKTIKVDEWQGRKSYTCTDCKAIKMPLESAKKHVNSVAHKRKDNSKMPSAALDAECKEMRRRSERSGIVYHCVPCAFQTDSILHNKNHIQEANHKSKTSFYCHVCKNFSRNKSEQQEHRFSIKHKKASTKLEEDCGKPFVKSKKPEPIKEKKKEVEEKNGEEPNESENFSCSFCKFTGKDSDELESHKNTSAHKRLQCLFTKQSADLEEFRFNHPGERCETTEEMTLIRIGEDLKEMGEKDKSLRVNVDLKKKQEDLVQLVFEGKVYTQMEIKTKVKCNTCKTMLNGKEKQLIRQLLAHLTSTKHHGNLKVQIKAEVHSNVDRNTAQQQEEEQDAADAAAEAAAAPLESSEAAEPESSPVPSLNAPDGEKLSWLVKNDSIVVCAMSDTLFYCKPCKTGAKPLKEFFEHIVSEEHKTGMCEKRDWRQYLDMIDIYEHGEELFKVGLLLELFTLFKS